DRLARNQHMSQQCSRSERNPDVGEDRRWPRLRPLATEAQEEDNDQKDTGPAHQRREDDLHDADLLGQQDVRIRSRHGTFQTAGLQPLTRMRARELAVKVRRADAPDKQKPLGLALLISVSLTTGKELDGR